MKHNPFLILQIAVEGCCHGELDQIYETMQRLEDEEGKKIDLLISCGDFQAMRNLDDMETMACPPKYRQMGTFYKYYSGEKVAPYPTLFSKREMFNCFFLVSFCSGIGFGESISINSYQLLIILSS